MTADILEQARERQVNLGPVIGSLRGVPIHEWIEWVGECRWIFKEMAVHNPPGSGCVELDQLKPGEAVFAPGAIYERATDPPCGKSCGRSG